MTGVRLAWPPVNSPQQPMRTAGIREHDVTSQQQDVSSRGNPVGVQGPVSEEVIGMAADR